MTNQSDLSAGGYGNCSVCAHPGVAYINAFIRDGKVLLDGRECKTVRPIIEFLNNKYPEAYALKDYNISRHKPHVKAFEGGTALILKGTKLYKPGLDGELQEIRQFEPDIALKIIISKGLDDLINGRIKSSTKVLVDAIKIYADIMGQKGEHDDYDRIVADAHKGKVIDVTPSVVQDDGFLDIPVSQIPDGVVPPEMDDDEEE